MDRPKTYEYHSARYVISVSGPLVILIGLFVWAVYHVAGGEPASYHWAGVIVLPVLIGNHIIGGNHPKRIIDDGETLTFAAFGRSRSYQWDAMTEFKVKEFFITDRVYLRINKPGVFTGRYWLDVFQLNDGEEILAKFKQKEAELHPERLRYQKRKPQRLEQQKKS